MHEILVRGEIDNSVEGRTTGLLWVLGCEEPVMLDLQGDCWRDLAGTRLKFKNPNPVAVPGLSISPLQKGVVGDMTASRRTKVPECSIDELMGLQRAGKKVPTVWKNLLYLEWFSETNGRVVVEATDFELSLGDRLWSMDEDGEEAQKLANMQAMRDFLEGMIKRLPPSPEGKDPAGDDEFEWEERLKESDRLSDAYGEVIEKYKNDPASEQKGAFVMGWDGLLESMADAEEGEEPEMSEWEEAAMEAEQELEEAEGWMDDDDLFAEHPLQVEAMELAMRAMDLIRGRDSAADSDEALVSSMIMQVAAKLAGALGGKYDREAGFVLAILKRCLNWLQEAVGACSRLIGQEEDANRQAALKAIRDEIFSLRGKLSELRRELKGPQS